ncbi:MAG TPA: response regulator [Bauldia sp.]|nr:response regulator [Bauldia sp.]
MPAFAPEGPRGPQERLSSRRVLIAEDDHLVSVEIEAALLDAGFEVTGVAISVEEAIEHARRQIPDLVVMDIRLVGDGDGVDAALELFREHGIRCLFATAHIDSAMRRRAEPARPLGWIAKPYDPRLLVKAVERAFHALERE